VSDTKHPDLMTHAMRTSYERSALDEKDLPSEPSTLFKAWFQDAVSLNVPDANAMVLSTSTPEGFPSSRIVLLKELSDRGFVFFTNYKSRKANQLLRDEKASLLFFWPGVERQVRVLGHVSKIPQKESESYFQSRPRGSQVAAWASPQSHPIADRRELESNVALIEEKFSGASVLPLPEFWGGYVLEPIHFEFWQGRANRLHDRFEVTNVADSWRWQRLAP
jgi:pyridoxamine 5'-phosphate oxidase